MTEDISDIKFTLYSSIPTSKATTAVSSKSVSACSLFLSVSLLAQLVNHTRNVTNCFVHVAYGRGVAVSYVLPVLWMTSCFM